MAIVIDKFLESLTVRGEEWVVIDGFEEIVGDDVIAAAVIKDVFNSFAEVGRTVGRIEELTAPELGA